MLQTLSCLILATVTTSWRTRVHMFPQRGTGPAPRKVLMAEVKGGSRPKSSKGFGSGTATMKKKPKAVVQKEPVVEEPKVVVEKEPVVEEFATPENSHRGLRKHLNPKHFEDPATMADVAKKLQEGELVVLRDAFDPEFAEEVYAQLTAEDLEWELDEAYFDDGFGYHHHRVYNRSSWSAGLNATKGVFEDDASKEFMTELSGRNCRGDIEASPSWYKSGDHLLPHTDWAYQRTVAFVWHLSKDWKPEWGGSLYWAQNHHQAANFPPSFNTLLLFSVTPKTAHHITLVTPYSESKRLGFNGWYHSSWWPSSQDDLPSILESEKNQLSMTHAQLQVITNIVVNGAKRNPEWDMVKLKDLWREMMQHYYPSDDRFASV